MKNRIKKLFAIVAACGMTMAMMGCGDTNTSDAQADGNNNNSKAEAGADENAELTGKVTMAGSTSMEKLASGLQEEFMKKYPGVTVTAEFTGSGAGLESLAAGSVDIGNASRALSDEEKANGVVENIVAIDGIAVITDTNNTVVDLTTEQLADIYTGEISNWSEVGGADQNIVVVGREAGSGTRNAFEELLEISDACAYAQELDSTGGVLASVAATPGAIGYVSLDVVDDTVSSVKLNGVEATEEKILAGEYALQRPFVMATKGEISEQSEAVQAFFEYIKSDEGKAVIKQVGLIIPE